MILKRRHIVKTLTWRVIASGTTFLIAWMITGEIKTGLSIGLVGIIVKMVLYYFHERLWYQTKFGVLKDG